MSAPEDPFARSNRTRRSTHFVTPLPEVVVEEPSTPRIAAIDEPAPEVEHNSDASDRTTSSTRERNAALERENAALNERLERLEALLTRQTIAPQPLPASREGSTSRENRQAYVPPDQRRPFVPQHPGAYGSQHQPASPTQASPIDPSASHAMPPPRVPPGLSMSHRDVRSGTHETSSSTRPRLKPADIGYWSPHDTTDTPAAKEPLRIPVELFIKRIKKLAKVHGEQQVLDNMDSALVNLSTWLTTFTDEEDALTGSIDGWCHLLQQEFGMPRALSRQQAKEYSFSHAKDASEFWSEKLSRLRIGGIEDPLDQYLEIWECLPTKWKETIPMEGSLVSLKLAIRQRELAAGWPRRTDEYRSAANKRGGGLIQPSRVDKRNRTAQDSDEAPLTDCRICTRLGKPGEKHWHVKCPNREKAEKMAQRINAILLMDESDLEEPESSAPSAMTGLLPASLVPAPISHVRTEPIVNAVKSDTFRPKTHASPRIFDSEYDDTLESPGNLFRRAGPAHVYLRGTASGANVRVCVDSGCGPTIRNAAFVLKLFPHAKVQDRAASSIPLRVKGGFNGTDYTTLNQYVSVDAFLPTTHGNLLRLRLEVHLTSTDVAEGLLLGLSMLKTNKVSLDFDKELLTTQCVQSHVIKVPIYLLEKHQSVHNHGLKAQKDMVVPPGHECLVPVSMIDMPKRDFFFQGQFISNMMRTPNAVIDSSCSRVIVANFGDSPKRIREGQILGHVRDLGEHDSVSTVSSVSGIDREYMVGSDFQ